MISSILEFRYIDKSGFLRNANYKLAKVGISLNWKIISLLPGLWNYSYF